MVCYKKFFLVSSLGLFTIISAQETIDPFSYQEANDRLKQEALELCTCTESIKPKTENLKSLVEDNLFLQKAIIDLCASDHERVHAFIHDVWAFWSFPHISERPLKEFNSELGVQADRLVNMQENSEWDASSCEQLSSYYQLLSLLYTDIITLICNHLDILLDCEDIVYFGNLKKVIFKFPHPIKKALFNQMITHSESYQHRKYGMVMSIHLARHLGEPVPYLCEEMAKGNVALVAQLMQGWYRNDDLDEHLFSFIRDLAQQLPSNQTAHMFMKRFTFTPSSIGAHSATERHLKTKKDMIIKSLTYFDDPALYQIFEQINEEQKHLEQEGYVVFVHGQSLDKRLCTLWFNYLWELTHKQQLNDFLFMHIKNLENPISKSQKKKSKKQRQKIRKDGRFDAESRQQLLFLNIAFFGNEERPGSSTAHYFKKNCNASYGSIPLRESFANHNLEYLYEHFLPEFDELEKAHRTITNYGNVYLIAIPRHLVSKCVFAAEVGGAKKAVYIKGIGWTDDIESIIDAYMEDPSKIDNADQLEFCLIMDHKYGLNPESGIIAKDFIAPSSDKKTMEHFGQLNNDLQQKVKETLEDPQLVERLKKEYQSKKDQELSAQNDNNNFEELRSRFSTKVKSFYTALNKYKQKNLLQIKRATLLGLIALECGVSIYLGMLLQHEFNIV